MQGVYGEVDYLCRLCKDQAIDSLAQAYLTEARDFIQRFKTLEQKLYDGAPTQEHVDVRVLALMAATELNIPISLAPKDPTEIRGAPGLKKKLLIALREALTDAARACAATQAGPVSIDVGSTPLGEAPHRVRSHFTDLKAAPNTKLAYVLIQHTGTPFPARVLKDFAKRRRIQRPDGSDSIGLSFTRRLVEDVNDGFMEIDSGGRQTRVAFWFSTQPISER